MEILLYIFLPKTLYIKPGNHFIYDRVLKTSLYNQEVIDLFILNFYQIFWKG